jgi:hypothetical protein
MGHLVCDNAYCTQRQGGHINILEDANRKQKTLPFLTDHWQIRELDSCTRRDVQLRSKPCRVSGTHDLKLAGQSGVISYVPNFRSSPRIEHVCIGPRAVRQRGWIPDIKLSLTKNSWMTRTIYSFQALQSL